jgi:hypothetical protein
MVRRHLGSVSARVVAAATCSVTVVRRVKKSVSVLTVLRRNARSQVPFSNSSHCSVNWERR